MTRLTQELIASLPIIRFDKSWRVRLLPIQFPDDGEMFRFRIYKQAECVSVIGWETEFNFYALLDEEEWKLTYAEHKQYPNTLRDIVNRMLATSKHNARARKQMLGYIAKMQWPEEWLLESCKADTNGDILAEVSSGPHGVCIKFRQLRGVWEIYTPMGGIGGFDYDDYSGVTEFLRRWL